MQEQMPVGSRIVECQQEHFKQFMSYGPPVLLRAAVMVVPMVFVVLVLLLVVLVVVVVVAGNGCIMDRGAVFCTWGLESTGSGRIS